MPGSGEQGMVISHLHYGSQSEDCNTDDGLGVMMDGSAGFSVHPNCDDMQTSASRPFAFEAVINEICGMRWETIDAGEVMQVAKVYYYFSIQFRENLEVACRLHPHDEMLKKLREGECDTDNLSPGLGVAAVGEKLDHDEFMRRLLSFQTIRREAYLEEIGEEYLSRTRALDDATRAASIASYEDNGLSRVFTSMLRARNWQGAGPAAFKFFLEEHIRFDSDDDGGHGALARHLNPDDRILPLWTAFRDMLVAAVPRLEQMPVSAVMDVGNVVLMAAE
jgi:hypothetical protein